ncbi:Cytochrome b-c1 complex subunit 7 [Cystobasidiomycetes sp. EMM_F5]
MGYWTPLGISLAKQVRASRTFNKPIQRIAEKYAQWCGYRQHGLKYDDLIIEESETVQKALKRLTPREEYDRAYRLRVASQLSVLHHPLPKEQQLTADQDVRYLQPLIEEITAEMDERAQLDTAILAKKAAHTGDRVR